MNKELTEYNKKRNFEKTKEPKGQNGLAQKDNLRFVVQYHIATRAHFDFRLEYRGVLLSWAVPKGPSFNPLDKRLAVMVEDHPLEYRNFEGVIPKGNYGAGTVMIWDEGYYAPLTTFENVQNSGSIKFVLSGKRLKGGWALVKVKRTENQKDNNWLLIKENDMYAKPDAGISEYKTSVRSGKTTEEIEKE